MKICSATWLNVLLIKTQNAHVIDHMRSKLSSEHTEHMALWRVDILAVLTAAGASTLRSPLFRTHFSILLNFYSDLLTT